MADEIIRQANVKLHYLVGTMIELPRAAMLADEIAEVAEFFSFGTNDLTQTVMGLSRDDAGRFLPDYVDEKKTGIFKGDPFQTLDVHGVGMMVRWGEVLPPGGDGLCQRVPVSRADRTAGGGAGRGGREKGREGKEEVAATRPWRVRIPDARTA